MIRHGKAVSVSFGLVNVRISEKTGSAKTGWGRVSIPKKSFMEAMGATEMRYFSKSFVVQI